jgi:WD40 repeat protein
MTTTTRANPYVGPRSFTTGETLYGRDRETSKLLNLLIAERIVLLYSPSGAGKTSLIQAALVPQLHAEGFLVLPVIRVSAEPPAPSAESTGLRTELTATTGNSVLGPVDSVLNRYVLSALLSLEEGLPADRQLPLDQLASMSLADYLGHREAEFGDSDGIVLLFDQFEEVLTVDPTDVDAKHAFFQQIGAALRDRRRWALFAMREDYLAPLDPYLRPIPTRLSTTFRLDLLEEPAARLAMQQPARLAGVQFGDAAARALADDLRCVQVQRPDGTIEQQLGLYVEPVQLQVVCYRLWSQLPPDDTEIDVDDIAAVGDVDGALTAYYVERVAEIAATTGVGERAIRDWFDRQLITEHGIRGQVLQGAERSAGLENRAIWPLIDAHLVRGEKRRGATWFELAHDRLIAPIRADNATWRDANLSVLQRQAALWDQQSRPEGLLLRDAELADAERWAAAYADVLTDVEREYLETCRNLREVILRARRANRRVRILAVVASLAFVIAIALATLAFRSSQAARSAEAQAQAEKQNALSAFGTAEAERGRADQQSRAAYVREIAAQAANSRERRPQRGLLLALEAADPTRQPDVRLAVGEEALRDALAVAGGTPLVGPQSTLRKVAFSSDGKYLALGHMDGMVELRDLATPSAMPVILRGVEGEVRELMFSPDASSIAAQSGDGRVLLWTVTNPSAAPVQLPGSQTPFVDMAFSADKRTLAIGGDDGMVQLWDLANLSAPPVRLRAASPNQPAAPIFVVAFSSDGRRLAAASDNGTLWLWDVADLPAQPEVLFEPQPPKPISALMFAPDGETLAATTLAGTLQVWTLSGSDRTTNELRSASGSFATLAFSPDGGQLAGTLYDGSVLIWEVADLSAAPYVVGGAEEALEAVAYSPDGLILAGAGRDGVARLWLAENLSAVPDELHGHEAELTALAFSPDGRRLVTGDSAGAARLWAIDQPQVAPQKFGGFDDPVAAAALSPDGALLAAAHADTLLLWNVADPAQPTVVLQESSQEVVAGALDFSPDGRILAAGDQAGRIQLWNMADLSASPVVLRDRGVPVARLLFSSDARYLAAVDGGGAARLWAVGDPSAMPIVLREEMLAPSDARDLPTPIPPATPDRSALPVFQTLTAIATRGPVSTTPVAATPTGTPEAVLEPEVDITEEVLEDETIVPELEETTVDEPVEESEAPLLAPPALLAVASPAIAIGEFKVLAQITPTPPPGEPRRTPPPGQGSPQAGTSPPNQPPPGTSPANPAEPPDTPPPGPTAPRGTPPSGPGRQPTPTPIALAPVRFSPDGRYVAVASASEIKLWTLADLAASPAVIAVAARQIDALAFSPDGRSLAVSGGDGMLSVWAVDQPQAAPVLLAGAARSGALAFSPDGRWLVAGGQDAQLRLWSLSDPQAAPALLRGHDAAIRTAAFSPDGRYLATAGEDQTVRLWDTAHLDGESVVLQGHTGSITTLMFSQDGRLLLTRDEDQAAFIWQPRLDDLRALACATAGRNLTIAEWQLFIGSEPYRKTCPALPLSDTLVESADDLIQQSASYTEALKLVARVGELNAMAEIPPPAWDRLCWEGSLAGRAADLIEVCDRAVAAAPGDGLFQESRGLARALAGDLSGAAADFKAYVAWAQTRGIDEGRIAKRREWIAALEGGRSPFDDATLQALRDEANEHRRPEAAQR